MKTVPLCFQVTPASTAAYAPDATQPNQVSQPAQGPLIPSSEFRGLNKLSLLNGGGEDAVLDI